MTFKGRIISRSNINGKIYTFQKDFDDYESYEEFLSTHPEYSARGFFENFWNPWVSFDRFLPSYQETHNLLPDGKYLPEGVDLSKYEKRRLEKRQTEAEKIARKQSLEKTEAYLKDYLDENPDDEDAKKDLEKVQKEIQALTK